MSCKKKKEREQTFERLDALWARELPELPLAGTRYVFMSDLHLGDGNEADDFCHNEEILTTALDQYNDQGYILVLLGDIEELWQFEMYEIHPRYVSSVYQCVKKFGNQRVHRVFGNHDIDWGSPPDPVIQGPPTSRGAPEGLKLTDSGGRARVFLVHGHQGTAESDKGIWFSRFVVRAPWRFFEPILRGLGLYRYPSEPKSRVMKHFERIRYEWAKSKQSILICGHTHRAIFASQSHAEILREDVANLETDFKDGRVTLDPKTFGRELKGKKAQLRDERRKGRDIDIKQTDVELKPCYFNTGCGLYASCITAIELDGDDIRLVKWQKQPTDQIQPKVLQAGKISDMLNQL